MGSSFPDYPALGLLKLLYLLKTATSFEDRDNGGRFERTFMSVHSPIGIFKQRTAGLLASIAAVSLLVGACGSGTEEVSGDGETTVAPTTEEPTTEEPTTEEPTTEEPTTEEPTTEEPTTEDPEPEFQTISNESGTVTIDLPADWWDAESYYGPLVDFGYAHPDGDGSVVVVDMGPTDKSADQLLTEVTANQPNDQVTLLNENAELAGFPAVEFEVKGEGFLSKILFVKTPSTTWELTVNSVGEENLASVMEYVKDIKISE